MLDSLDISATENYFAYTFEYICFKVIRFDKPQK